ncbi:MAG: hypothetical protein LBQ86_08760 [Holophagales bacterium]|nr:hypothetical protein [Holophagales bacterium]
MRDADVAPKCVAFREARNAYDAVSVARRDLALAAADYSISGSKPRFATRNVSDASFAVLSRKAALGA